MARLEPDPRAAWAGAEFDRLVRAADPGEDLICVGADLHPDTLVAAYSHGVFPMGLGRHGSGRLGWWSPDPRGVLPLDGLIVSSSLRRSLRRYEIRVDSAFAKVVHACAAPDRSGRWITPTVAAAYVDLHHRGLAHSVEAWQGDDLVGGLYGVSIGGLFAGESMFHRATDASKVALVALVQILRSDGQPRLLDVQWRTDHLGSLGVIEIPRADYLAALRPALALRAPLWPRVPAEGDLPLC